MDKGGIVMELIIWLAIAVVMIIMEIVSLGLTTIWFAGGALIAALVAFLGGKLMLQIMVFSVVSLVLLIFTRPIAQKHLMKNTEKTNVESLIGKIGIVTADIRNLELEGVVKLNGLEWSARSEDETDIPKGSKVEVKAVSGVKLIVVKR